MRMTRPLIAGFASPLLALRSCLLISAVSILPALAYAQSGVGNTTSTPVAGVPHDYIAGLNEIVNPGNGALSIRIPQPVPLERGQNWPSYAFIYDSNGNFALQPQWSISSTNPTVTSLVALTYGPGFSISPGTIFHTANNLSVCQQTSQSSCTTYTCTVHAGYLFADFDGGLHGLGLKVGVPVTTNTSNDCQFFSVNNYYTGGNERYKATMDSSTLAVTLVDLHGNQPTLEDVNGNYHNTTNRTASVPARSTVQLLAVSQPSERYNVTATSGDSSNACPVTSIPPPTQPSTVNVVRSVTLPNGQQYTFGYDSAFGLLNKITYPTGATVTFTWSVIPKSQGLKYNQNITTGLGGVCSLQYDWFAITKRVVSYDGITNAQEQDFAYSTVWPNAQAYQWTSKATTVTTKDLIRGTSFQTVYNYLPMLPPSESDKPWEDLGYVPVENTVQYFGTDGSLLKTTSKSWATSNILSAECTTLPNGLTSGRFYTYQPYTPNLGAIWAPDAQKTNLPTDVAEYDYGQVSSSCAQPSSSVIPLRETQTTYQSFANTPLFAYPALQDRPSTIKIYGAVNGTKALLAETDYAYDGSTPSAVSPTPYGHDEAHYGSGSTAPRGNPTTVTKKCFVGSTNCTNSVAAYSYDTTGQVLTTTDANLNTTTYSYTDNYTTDDGSPSANTNAFVTKITRPTTNGVAHVTAFQYGFNDGKLRMVTDENNQQTKYCYWTGGCSGNTLDPFVRLTGSTAPDDGSSTITYNDASYNPSTPSPSVITTKKMNSSASITSLAAFDGIGQNVRNVLSPDPDCVSGDRTDTVYDGMGRVYTVSNSYCSTTDPTYGLTTYVYDALGRTTSVTHPDGATILLTYTGRATQVQDEGNGNGTQRVTRISQTDGLGRLISMCEVAPGPFVGSGGASSSSLIGQNGAPAACGLDISGTGFLTSYQYDALDNLKQVNQGTMAARTFTYDSLSRLTSSANPESNTSVLPSITTVPTNYVYDANGNLSSKTAPAPNQNGTLTVTTNYTYDALNRMTAKSYSDGTTPSATFVYDAPTGSYHTSTTNPIGRLVQATSGCSLTFYRYDAVGRVTSQIQELPVTCATNYPYFGHTYTYDLMGNMTSFENGEFQTFTYGYNGVARLSSVTSSYTNNGVYALPANLLSGAHYNALGSITSDTLGDGESETWSYDKRGRLTSQAATLSGTTLYSLTMTSYAPNSNVLAVSDSANGSWNYSYDQFNRLVCANLAANGTCATPPTGSPTYTYVYDRFGNRWQQNGPVFNTVNFTGNNPSSPANTNRIDGYSYDTAGNLTNDSHFTYGYDAENRLVSVAGGTTNSTYIYDALGHRIGKTGNSTECGGGSTSIYYLYDLQDRVAVFVPPQGTNNCKDEIYAGGRHLGTYLADLLFSHADWLGTERMRNNFRNPTTWVETCSSLPFGDNLVCSVTEPTPYESPLHFTGKERDFESGLDNFGARQNSSSLGRFMSPDPLGGRLINPQTLNKYSYVTNSPLNYVDPTGLYLCKDSGKCDSDQDKAFEKARQLDLNSKDQNVVRDAKAYGDKNTDNGVTVQFGDPGEGKNGITVHDVRVDPNDPSKVQAAETVTIRSGLSGTSLAETVGHEGGHVADAQDFVNTIDTKSGAADQSKNLTKYATELKSYLVSNSILTSANEKRNFGDCGLDPCTLGAGVSPARVLENINRLLANPKNYGVTPANPGPVLYPLLTTPK